jgi:hypothetical protein
VISPLAFGGIMVGAREIVVKGIELVAVLVDGCDLHIASRRLLK